MARYYRENKRKWKSILCGILLAATVIGACAGLAVIGRNDTKTIGSSAFTVGALDEAGKYVESNQSVYTKDAFECIGLRVEPDFESQARYDVYYYDANGNFLTSVTDMASVYDEDYPLAQYARIVIYPEIPENVKKNDFEITFWDISDIVSNLDITVNKKQEYLYENCLNLYNPTASDFANKFAFDTEQSVVVNQVANNNAKMTGEIAIDGNYDKFDIYVKNVKEDNDISLFGVIAANGETGENDKILESIAVKANDLKVGEWCKITLDVSDYDDAAYIRVHMPIDAECYIFGYGK